MLFHLNRLSLRNRIWMVVALLIGGIVSGSIVDVLMLRNALWQEKELKTRQVVESGYSVLAHFHGLQLRGELSEASAQAAAISTIKDMRYDGIEYFWLNDLGTPFPKMIMHPTMPSLDGQILDSDQFDCALRLRTGTDGDFVATDGKKNLFVAFVEVVNRSGRGYVTYSWPKPKAGGGVTDERFPKLSYVQKFEPWGWLIGSGIYIDDVDSAVRTQAERNFLLTALFGLLLLFFASVIVRSITHPLRQIVKTMRAIGTEENGLGLRLPVEGDSELAELARGFNDMLEHIETRDAELARHREGLEEEVGRRTSELREVNEHLVAEQKEVEALMKKMEEARDQLVQSEKLAAIGQLAAGVAHEINNPIGYVNSNMGTLEKYVANFSAVLEAYEKAEPSLDAVSGKTIRDLKKQLDLAYVMQDVLVLLTESREGLCRVKKIVQDLKDFSHVDQVQHWRREDLHKGLESTLNVVWNELKYKCTIKKEFGNLPLVECLLSQLNQVFMNLLVNAAQAIEGHGVITLSTGTKGERVWVEVADTGKGIPPENIPRLFNPFFTTKPVGKGTGLGLSVSYSIVKKHRGEITVTSSVGVGTAFRIWLPIVQTEGENT